MAEVKKKHLKDLQDLKVNTGYQVLYNFLQQRLQELEQNILDNLIHNQDQLVDDAFLRGRRFELTYFLKVVDNIINVLSKDQDYVE